MGFGSGGPKDSLPALYAASGLGGMLAALFTHPIDVLKVRQQVASGAKLGPLQVARDILRTQGLFGLYAGMSASLLRQASYTTVRFGAYLQLKDYLQARKADPTAPPTMLEKIGASALAGMVGALVGTPADVVLVRMQADGRLPAEQRRNYSHALEGLVRIARSEGIATLWKGVGPNVWRAAAMTSGQLASYDTFKDMLMAITKRDDSITQLGASTLAGFVACVVTNPLDVVKTRVMNASPGTYTGTLDCVRQTLVKDGPLAFYKGFVPYFARLGPHTVLQIMLTEWVLKGFRMFQPQPKQDSV